MNIEEPRNSVFNLVENMVIEESLHTSAQLNSIVQCFSLSEVAGHDDASDCWIVVYDRVYKITDFLDKVKSLSFIILMLKLNYKMFF